MKRVLIAFDFDHTLIDKNSDTYVLRLIPDGGQLPASIRKLYSTENGWNDYMREVFRYLHSSCGVTRDQLLSCVAEIPLVEGMRELLEYLNVSTMTASKTAATHSDSATRDVEKVAVLSGTPGDKVGLESWIENSDFTNVNFCLNSRIFTNFQDAVIYERLALFITVLA